MALANRQLQFGIYWAGVALHSHLANPGTAHQLGVAIRDKALLKFKGGGGEKVFEKANPSTVICNAFEVNLYSTNSFIYFIYGNVV